MVLTQRIEIDQWKRIKKEIQVNWKQFMIKMMISIRDQSQKENYQWYRVAVLNRGDLGPRDIWQCVETFSFSIATAKGQVLLVSNEWKLGAAKHPTMHRTASHNEELSNPNINSDEIEKPCCKGFIIKIRPQAMWELAERFMQGHCLCCSDWSHHGAVSKESWHGAGGKKGKLGWTSEDTVESMRTNWNLHLSLTAGGGLRRGWCPVVQRCTHIWSRRRRSWWRSGGRWGAAALCVGPSQQHPKAPCILQWPSKNNGCWVISTFLISLIVIFNLNHKGKGVLENRVAA